MSDDVIHSNEPYEAEDWLAKFDALSESHANAVCALMTAQAENTRLKDDLGQAVILLRRFEAGDNYFAADCHAFLARHGGER